MSTVSNKTGSLSFILSFRSAPLTSEILNKFQHATISWRCCHSHYSVAIKYFTVTPDLSSKCQTANASPHFFPDRMLMIIEVNVQYGDIEQEKTTKGPASSISTDTNRLITPITPTKFPTTPYLST